MKGDMKIKPLVVFSLAAAAMSIMAMPTKQELKQVEGHVWELMRPEVDAMTAGTKTYADVARAAVGLAEKSETETAKMLLLKGAFTCYVRHGTFDEAIETLRALKATIPDIPPQIMSNIVVSALHGLPNGSGDQLYRVLGEMESQAGNLYCVVDLSAGPSATKYPVSYVSDVPEGTINADAYKTTKLVLRRIDPGTFIMGADQTNESHRVMLTKPFYIGVFEVTQRQYELVTGENPSKHRGNMRPVEMVSYKMIRGAMEGVQWPASSVVDAYSFMGKFSARTGLKFDLPTEAQWEYACRAGTTSTFNIGGHSTVEDMVTKLGRHKDSGGIFEHHAVVGSYLPNAWGLYDMHGNVIEWCRDRWGALSYGTDPKGSSEGSPLETGRIWRGGGWKNPRWCCTSSWRSRCRPHGKSDDVGFRLALLLPDK